MLNVERFVNTPVPSNTYLLSREDLCSCIVIDPGTKDETQIHTYIQRHCLRLDYIILTHEHFDHCWGVNSLLEYTEAKVIASRKCADTVIKPSNFYNKFYFNSEETYCVKRVDLIIEEMNYTLDWDGINLFFLETKGHSDKSICISLDNNIFTGDTLLLNTKPVLMKRMGSSKEELKASIDMIFSKFLPDTIIYPGHGAPFILNETKDFYESYFETRYF